jgi:ferrous iron transport protein A
VTAPRFDLPQPASNPAPTCLACAVRGQRLVVGEVLGNDALADRLRVSGLWAGAIVELIGNAPFGGPLLFKLHGFRLALRRSEAERVTASAETADSQTANSQTAGTEPKA